MRNAALFVATALAAAVLSSGPLATSAGAASPPPAVTVAGLRIQLLPPSPCRPSETGASRCLDVGRVVQISAVPPSPCTGLVCTPVQ